MLALDTATLAAKTRGFSEEVNGLGATAAAARLSSRAGRPKPRHAKDGAAILRVLGRRGGPEGRLSVVRYQKSSRAKGAASATASASAPKFGQVAGKSPKKGVWPAI